MEPIACLNSEILPASQLQVSPIDQGFLLGVVATERLRTFRGKLFKLQEHLQRFARSLEIMQLKIPESPDKLAEQAVTLVEHNYPLLSQGDDLGLSLFATPGINWDLHHERVDQKIQCNRPTVVLQTSPIPMQLLARQYKEGVRLAFSHIKQIPADTLPPELKCRSRMHYYLADLDAARQDPGARAILLDQAGLITEASTANIIVYRKHEGLISPPKETILPGISVAEVERMASKLNIPFHHQPLSQDDLLKADAIMLSSTTACLVQVTHLQGKLVGTEFPHPIYDQLMDEWDKIAGFQVRGQASLF